MRPAGRKREFNGLGRAETPSPGLWWEELTLTVRKGKNLPPSPAWRDYFPRRTVSSIFQVRRTDLVPLAPTVTLAFFVTPR